MCSPEINISFLRYLYFMKWNNFLRVTTVLVPASFLCFMDRFLRAQTYIRVSENRVLKK